MTKKPLELTIYPPVPAYPPSVPPGGNAFTRAVQQMQASLDWQVERMAEAALSQRKRLNDTELAAEYWQADYADVRHDREDEDLEPIPEIIMRFGTFPHFDQEEP